MKTAIITFSPTGGTRKCADALAQGIGETVQNVDLTDRDMGMVSICAEAEIVLIAVPSYGGRMPSLAAERLKKVEGCGKPTVLLAVYGNRAFEDTLVELEDLAKAQKFTTIAAASAIAQHCMDGKIATNRPDAGDLFKLQEFGQEIVAKFTKGSLAAPHLPGNRPYKNAGPVMHPAASKSCTACGLCARQCPAGAIDPVDPKKTDAALCIGCMRCVANCPTHARNLNAPSRFLVHTLLSIAAGKRKEPQLFI